MAKLDKETVTVEEGTPVKGVDPVEIMYNEKAKFHKKGEKTTVHRLQADGLVKKGIADYVK